MTTKELRQVLDWADEGKLQTRSISTSSEWNDVNYNYNFNGQIGSGEPFSLYRRKPTEPTLRPWKPEEVPVGALIRYNKDNKTRCLITGITNKNNINHWAMLVGNADLYHRGVVFLNDAINSTSNYEHSLDHGKTWLPCGVMEQQDL